MIIVLEGVEGAGKSTQAKILASRIDGKIRKEIILPTDSLAEIMKKRAMVYKEVQKTPLIPSIYDRFFHSTIAYQCYLENYDINKTIAMHEESVGGVMPDITFYLKVSPHILEQRFSAKSQEEMDNKRKFYSIEQKVQAMEYAIAHFSKNVVVIPAECSIPYTSYVIYKEYEKIASADLH